MNARASALLPSLKVVPICMIWLGFIAYAAFVYCAFHPRQCLGDADAYGT